MAQACAPGGPRGFHNICRSDRHRPSAMVAPPARTRNMQWPTSSDTRSHSSRLASFLQGLDWEAWKRFFIALAGLTLAMLAAIYSTVFRQAGNENVSVALASFSLVAAGL